MVNGFNNNSLYRDKFHIHFTNVHSKLEIVTDYCLYISCPHMYKSDRAYKERHNIKMGIY